MSHYTLYGVKPLLLYAATFKFTRDDLSESALRRNIGDKLTTGQLIDGSSCGEIDMVIKDLWTAFLQEPSIPGISLRKPLSKGTVHHQRLPSSLKKSATSSRKETKHYTKLGNGCQNCRGAHLDKDCPLKEEVKRIEEAKYDEFKLLSPFSNRAKYRVGPLGYYTRMDNRLSVGEKRPSLKGLMNKHLEKSTRRRTEIEEWLTKEFHTKAANELNSPSLGQCKVVYADEKTSLDDERNEISIASNKCTQIIQTNDVSPKILPYLGANVNVIPKSIFEHLKLARLKKIDILVEMADITKRSPIGIVKNVFVKFLFPSDFVVMNMLNTRNETMVLGRPFLATIHAEIDVSKKEISLGIGGDRVTFDIEKKAHNFATPIGEIYMINATSNTLLDASSRVEETNDVHNKNNSCNQEQGRSRKKPKKLEFDINLPSTHFCKPVKQILEGDLKFWPTCDPNIKECNGGHALYEMNKEGDLKK
nr:hypothetical protein [Tanacetum cinerariifolium]